MHTLNKMGGKWEVGYWTPGDADSHWITVAVLDRPDDACHLVSYLNGGPGNAVLAALNIANKINFAE
jgi:hypothetical protein